MSLRPDQIETFLKAINERTPPAPMARPVTGAQTKCVVDQLPLAFEGIGVRTVTDAALKAALSSDTYLYSLRERALYVQPTELLSRRFFRFRGRMPALHTTLVRLFTDAAGLSQHKVRIWNPFCGAGADSYSIAAMARLAQNATGAHVGGIEVIGTDVLPNTLKYADNGVYEFRRAEWRAHTEKLAELFGPESLTDEAELPLSTKHLPPGVEVFFTVARLAEGGYTITPGDALRQITKFRFVNLLRLPELGQLGAFDMVVTFTPTAIEDTPYAKQVRTALAYAIRPGGYLILRESSEPLLDLVGPTRGFETIDPGVFCRQR
jgi:chemotaxis methyl-accepting protein methylase